MELSAAQDTEAGDGTTSVVIVAGSLLQAADHLLHKGIHPTSISESFQIASTKAVEILNDLRVTVNMSDKAALIETAATSLNSKVIYILFKRLLYYFVVNDLHINFSNRFQVVSQQSSILAPLAVEAVLRIVEPGKENAVDLRVCTKYWLQTSKVNYLPYFFYCCFPFNNLLYNS